MKEYKLGIILTIVIVAIMAGSIVYFRMVGNTTSRNKKSAAETNSAVSKDDKAKKDKKKDDTDEDTAINCVGGSLVAQTTWDMPKELVEISGMAWMGDDKVATIQDTKGTIFIYNLSSKKVEKQIVFGVKGDYEGIAYAGGNFFVMRSDGVIYEADPKGKVLNKYELPLSTTDNIESFYFDAPNNRLLIGQKDGEKKAQSKNIYAFDLAARKFNPDAVYKIDLNDPVVSCNAGDDKKSKKAKKKSKQPEIRPSDIAIDPKSKDIYIADGPGQRILVLSPEGKARYYLTVDKKSFPQVEGLMFSPDGEFYISTEGVKGSGKISKVSVELN